MAIISACARITCCVLRVGVAHGVHKMKDEKENLPFSFLLNNKQEIIK